MTFADLRAALDAERAWQVAEHQRLCSAPVPERVRSGVTWAPVRGVAWAPGPDGGVLTVLPAVGGALHDGIRAGDLVRIGGLASPEVGPVGRVLDAEADGADVEVDVSSDDAPAGLLAVTRLVDTTTFDRMRAGLGAAERHRSLLRDALLAGRPTAPRPYDPPPPPLPDLDGSQLAAARAALASPGLAWIHGPPGTGKTTVIVSMARALVAAGERLWVLADSNAATDHLVRRLAAAGLRVVRPGAASRIAKDVAPHTLATAVALGPYGRAIELLQRDVGRATGVEARRLRDELRALSRRARDAALEAAEVMVTTLGTFAGTSRTSGDAVRARTAIVDEATQALEPSVWSVVPFVERMVLVGDPHQLGPVVMQPGNPLERSVLARLAASGAAPRLDVQHRMNERVMALVGGVYPGLIAAESVRAHRLVDLPGVDATELTERSVVLVDTAGAGADHVFDPVLGSWHNPGEAAVVAQVVRRLRGAGVSAGAIAVVTPYAGQVRRLRERLPDVHVSTVNGVQGQEFEAVVVSWVRSDGGAGSLGFVADRRRWVVALTRARRLLVVVGDTATLGRPPVGDLVDALAESPNAWQSALDPAWSDDEPP